MCILDFVRMSLKDKFREAAENVKKLKTSPNEDELLEIYALYKQAEFGNCDIPKPGMLDFQGKAKWEAWNKKKGVSKDDAMKEYIIRVSHLVQKYGLK